MDMEQCKLEKEVIENVFQQSQRSILTPQVLGIFKKGTKEEVITNLNDININGMLDISDYEIYDAWFDDLAVDFHRAIFPFYRENLIVHEDNPYTYSGRLLNRYIRHLTFRTCIFLDDVEEYLRIQHPIISNAFIREFDEIDINRVSNLQNREGYYSIVDHYRFILLKMNVQKQFDVFGSLKLGKDF